ncbi:MAG: D-tyrosyl-tRNA(Tyr) deacylase [Clostridia bacterium]|nr:D-tyrosyl-tRNA(Tyr) deacylase [Clostridia bacterium]
MIALIQRIKSASLTADGTPFSAVGRGFLVYLGVASGDVDADAEALAGKIFNLRVFEDENGKMNLSLTQIGGEILAVSNFTLLANCRHGNRPDFFGAEKPDEADRLYKLFVDRLKSAGAKVSTGVFGADMQITSVADGPVNIIIDSADLKKH